MCFLNSLPEVLPVLLELMFFQCTYKLPVENLVTPIHCMRAGIAQSV
jgi:hypothetical protein